jgi:hypothetical protein
MATDLLTVAQAITYPDLRRRLLKAYQAHSANQDPATDGDPHIEAKLGAKLATYDEDAIVHLLSNICADTCLSVQARYDLGDYAIGLRRDAMQRRCELVPAPSQQTSQHPHAS